MKKRGLGLGDSGNGDTVELGGLDRQGRQGDEGC